MVLYVYVFVREEKEIRINAIEINLCARTRKISAYRRQRDHVQLVT